MNSLFIDCSSPILQNNLEIEFKDILSTRKDAEAIITDYLDCKNCLKIGRDINPPLLRKYIKEQLSPKPTNIDVEEKQIKESNSGDLRAILESITAKYIDEVIKATEDFYEKR